MRKFLFVWLVALLAVHPAHAWWDEGHMVVAQIAQNHLTPRALARADALVPLGADARNNKLVTAACWPDDLKEDGVHFYDDWHYMDTPIGPMARDGKPEGRLLWAMNRCVAVLKPRYSRAGKLLPPAPDLEQARALRFLLHLVGDTHQPLHCASWYGKETPHGDRGGTDYPLAGDARNLHAFWDSIAGLSRGLTSRSYLAPIVNRAAQIEKEFPRAAIAEAANGDFLSWTRESTALARSLAYSTPRGKLPTPAYTAKAQRAALRRIAVAGYRLADLLNRIFDPTPA